LPPDPALAPIHPAAYYGLAGEIALALDPTTEADPIALLVQLLVACGNLMGRSAYYLAGGRQHHTNLYACLVGRSSRARKGTAWSLIRSLMARVDAEWVARRVLSGLTSGEGLIHSVRDPVTASEPMREEGRIVGYQQVIKDEGEPDKRLLVIEEEFARPLNRMKQDAALSAVLRGGWDSGDLHVLTRKPTHASNAHISVIGHITREELKSQLRKVDYTSGFANRFLWVYVQRSKSLPLGGQSEPEILAPFVARLAEACHYGASAGACGWDAGAERAWCDVYAELTAETEGPLGALTSRAEAQVIRLALIYALLDGTSVMGGEHLAAALAIWRYTEGSVRLIFGEGAQDRNAERILSHLRACPEGLKRSEITSGVFRGNIALGDLESALGVLEQQGLAQRSVVATEGRSAERWQVG
jgi:hypothetical protein